MMAARHSSWRCCTAAAALLAISLCCSEQAAAEATVRNGAEGGSTPGVLTDAAASAALEITYSDDRRAVRQLQESSGREIPEVRAIVTVLTAASCGTLMTSVISRDATRQPCLRHTSAASYPPIDICPECPLTTLIRTTCRWRRCWRSVACRQQVAARRSPSTCRTAPRCILAPILLQTV